jgi:hypothetical protein
VANIFCAIFSIDIIVNLEHSLLNKFTWIRAATKLCTIRMFWCCIYPYVLVLYLSLCSGAVSIPMFWCCIYPYVLVLCLSVCSGAVSIRMFWCCIYPYLFLFLFLFLFYCIAYWSNLKSSVSHTDVSLGKFRCVILFIWRAVRQPHGSGFTAFYWIPHDAIIGFDLEGAKMCKNFQRVQKEQLRPWTKKVSY